MTKHEGLIDFKKLRCSVKVTTNTEFIISVKMVDKSRKEFVFRAESKEALQLWIQVINANLPSHRGGRTRASPNFWKIACISNKELITSA